MVAAKNAKVNANRLSSVLITMQIMSVIGSGILYEYAMYHSHVPFLYKFTECIYNDERYASGAEWTDADDPCTSYKCVAGVVTESNIQCYTPCNNPLLPRPGHCCSTCMGELIFLDFVYLLFYAYTINTLLRTTKIRTYIESMSVNAH